MEGLFLNRKNQEREKKEAGTERKKEKLAEQYIKNVPQKKRFCISQG